MDNHSDQPQPPNPFADWPTSLPEPAPRRTPLRRLLNRAAVLSTTALMVPIETKIPPYRGD